MNLLISGFGPFSHHKNNPSQHVAKALADLDPRCRTSIILPVSYERSYLMLKDVITKHQPDVVIALGLAADRKTIDLEKVAINTNHSHLADNDQVIIHHKTIIDDAPLSYPSTLPLQKWQDLSKQHKQPVDISYHAGTFVCNNVLFKLLHDTQATHVQAGFIHLPSSIDLAIMVDTLDLFIKDL